MASSRAISPTRTYQCSTGPARRRSATTRMTTGASLKPDSASRTPVTRDGQRDLAQHGEDRRRVGRGDHRADDQRLPPVEPDQVVRGRRGDAHADRDADGRQHGGRRQRGFDLLPLRAQTALGQDHDQGGVADDLGQLGVVELDVADAVLPDGDADAEVDEQAGEPAAGRDADRRHGDEQDERADEQELVEVVDSQGPFPSLAPERGTRGGSRASDTSCGHRAPKYFVTLPNSLTLS